MCVAGQPNDVLDALDRKGVRHHRGAHGIALGLVQGIDHRGALGRADRDPREPVAERDGPRTPSSASSSCSEIVSVTGA